MTQDEVIELAKQADVWVAGQEPYQSQLEAFANLIAKKAYLDGLENGIKAEREACAKIADEWAVGWPHPSQSIAEWIRKRGQA